MTETLQGLQLTQNNKIWANEDNPTASPNDFEKLNLLAVCFGFDTVISSKGKSLLQMKKQQL